MPIVKRERSAKRLQSFTSNRDGAIAPMFALIIVPLIIAAGVGLDLARFTSAHNNLQDALDATGLALAHLPSGTPTDTLQADAQAWVTANLKDRNLGPVTVTVNPSTGVIDIVATSSVKTMLMGLAGISQLSMSAKSTVRWAPSNLELALVLDNTGSMADDNKLTSLQSAASSLVDSLVTDWSTNPAGLKIGVVPFSMTVNVGSQYQNASWMTGTQPAAYGADLFTSSANRFTLLSQMGVTWAGCVESRPMPYDVQDTAPTPSNPATMFVPFFAPDEPDDTFWYNGYGPYAYYVNSYLPDAGGADWKARQSNTAKYNRAPYSGTTAAGYARGPNSGCALAPLLPLTNNMTAVKNKLQSMVATGDTDIPMGLVWGWHVLSPNAPFANGSAYGTASTTKVAVLVTDGQNHYSHGTADLGYYNPGDNSMYTGIGYIWQNRLATNSGDTSDPAAAMNDRLTLLCNNMKAKGIIIYTMPVEVTDTTIKALLQNCASSPDKYIDVQNSSQLAGAFATIASSIGALRISN